MKHCQRAKHWVLTIRLVNYVERGNFPMILYRIVKNLFWRGHPLRGRGAAHYIGRNQQKIGLHRKGHSLIYRKFNSNY